ncbi:MAG: ATP-dependent DNA helicase RecG, partial [Pseudomonadota bacterium]
GNGDTVLIIATVESHQPPERLSKAPYKVICHTKEGFVNLIFFRAKAEYIKSILPIGVSKTISGKFERYGEILQIHHPDIIAPAEDFAKYQILEPIYGLTYALTNNRLSKTIDIALQKTPNLPEWIDEHLLARKGWNAWRQYLLALHRPQKPEDLQAGSLPKQRLAYDELLANQLALALLRQSLQKKQGQAIGNYENLRSKLSSLLPYRLTAGQEQVIAEIDADLASGNRMLRLLQGDVGSGKTVVALMSMLRIVEVGAQAALMCPTELLSKQHFAFIEKICSQIGVRIALLGGGMKTKEYNATLAMLAGGEIDIIVGTHALLQEKVVFKNLLLAVIDEQHRFGVNQRLTLTAKAKDTHVLVMTATPIPRTLTMTAFGDMDCSILGEKPPGRKEIATKAIPLTRIDEIFQAIERTTAKGDKVYWICPLVEESEDENMPSDLAAVEARYIEFKHRFGDKVAMAHGRMPTAEREEMMQGFAGDKYNILVATTVVEVGVDVPDATVIVIEHAERFGLAQLHQLRGRVGRSDKQSNCILLYKERLNEVAQARLKIIRDSNDGFLIAEEDLRLRGSGDILGTRQSGLPDFYFADIEQNKELLNIAASDVKLILHNDPELKSTRGEALRILLYLFGYDENIKFIKAG